MGLSIETLLDKSEKFTPNTAFSKQAHVPSMDAYIELYSQASQNPSDFWGQQASKELHWFEPWEKVLSGTVPDVEWFKGGKTNLAYNCIDRHIAAGCGESTALIWLNAQYEKTEYSFQQLQEEVNKCANALKVQGINKGDVVALYMPTTPQAVFTMLACARIGAIHSVIFGGFGYEALRNRLQKSGAKLVVTTDGQTIGGEVKPIKSILDKALENNSCPSVQKVYVYRHVGLKIDLTPGRDTQWNTIHPKMSTQCPSTALDAEHPLFLLYTSGTTGQPKGILHTTAGYNLYTHCTAKWVFDLKPGQDTFFCTADLGWITGHSYTVYGPLSNGIATIISELGACAKHPENFWKCLQILQPTVLYTAPTAIRMWQKFGSESVKNYTFPTLRVLGTVGEPISPETWRWYHKAIGNGTTPIVDTWWQTETGGIMISSMPGAIATKPGSPTFPMPGIMPQIVKDNGHPVPPEQGGYLVIRQPWPGMCRTLFGEHQRFKSTYWEAIAHPSRELCYFSGDGATKDAEGYYWILGRVDDVINVSGRRLGTMEIESALNKHTTVAESAVIGHPHPITGQSICAFVVLAKNSELNTAHLKEFVGNQLGKVAAPKHIIVVDELPKTRSGKIMRRLLRDILQKKTQGDTSTLENADALESMYEQIHSNTSAGQSLI